MTEAFNTTAFSIYFDELFPGYFHTYKYRFYVSYSMLMVIKIIAKKEPDPDVIRTRSLLIWSQTRYHCATESIYKKECPLMVKSVRVSSIFHMKES